MDKQEVLRRYFGHGEFREGQETLIDALLAGRDALGIMPTGGGKSLCYQVPALLLPGVTLVISPLISLMKDQVMALEKAGVPAAFLNSSLSAMERRAVYDGLRQGAYRLLYVAPERLETENFSALARELTIPLVAVDEAHCISQWGQDFRPSYRRIADFLSSLPRRPAVGAFTATATDLVQRDIVALLGLRDPVRAVTGFDRPNLFFDVRQPRNKGTAVLELLRQREGRSGIVYCATRATVERLCEALREHGIPATRYHAGLSEEERRQNQEDFQFDRCPVMVATNAFGMGIDKSNVSFVLHYNMPKSVEAYYQEAGRAGRDGERADCILLYSAADVATARFLIESSSGGDLPPEKAEEVRRQDYRRLSAITGYCRSTRCLRGELLDYFGQAHAERCGNCGNCLGDFRWEDITREAQMILSCVLRVREKLGFSVGKALIARTLRGSRDARVLQLGLDRVSTYGLLAKVPAAQIRTWMDHLELEGYLRVDGTHDTLEVTGKARGILFQGETVSLPIRADRQPERSRRRKAAAIPPAEDRLYDALRSERMRIAQAEGVPAYVVFSNAALADMAAQRPRSLAEFLEVSGVGEVKAQRYGEAFLQTIRAFEER